MRYAAIVLTALTLWSEVALAAADIEAPVHYTDRNGMTVIMRRGVKSILIHQGANDLGTRSPIHFTCRSVAGCAVDLSLSASIKDYRITGAEHLCAYIDGQEPTPGCGNYIAGPPGYYPFYLSFDGQTVVPAGTHSIQGVMIEGSTPQGPLHVKGWVARYTIYELTPR
jgi:hypothetical protein